MKTIDNTQNKRGSIQMLVRGNFPTYNVIRKTKKALRIILHQIKRKEGVIKEVEFNIIDDATKLFFEAYNSKSTLDETKTIRDYIPSPMKEIYDNIDRISLASLDLFLLTPVVNKDFMGSLWEIMDVDIVNEINEMIK